MLHKNDTLSAVVGRASPSSLFGYASALERLLSGTAVWYVKIVESGRLIEAVSGLGYEGPRRAKGRPGL